MRWLCIFHCSIIWRFALILACWAGGTIDCELVTAPDVCNNQISCAWDTTACVPCGNTTVCTLIRNNNPICTYHTPSLIIHLRSTSHIHRLLYALIGALSAVFTQRPAATLPVTSTTALGVQCRLYVTSGTCAALSSCQWTNNVRSQCPNPPCFPVAGTTSFIPYIYVFDYPRLLDVSNPHAVNCSNPLAVNCAPLDEATCNLNSASCDWVLTNFGTSGTCTNVTFAPHSCRVID